MRKMNQIVWVISLLMTASLIAQTGNVSGKVSDENGNPLPGANVVVDGTTMGAAAGSDGSFLVKNVPVGSYTLTVSVIGFAPKSESVVVSEDGTTINFSLVQSILPSDEIVVSASKRAEKIVDAPVTIAVINEAKIRRSTGFNVGALMKEVKGADIYQAGIHGIGVNAR